MTETVTARQHCTTTLWLTTSLETLVFYLVCIKSLPKTCGLGNMSQTSRGLAE